MKKIKVFILRFITAIEKSQMAKAQRILANSKHGIGSWE